MFERVEVLYCPDACNLVGDGWVTDPGNDHDADGCRDDDDDGDGVPDTSDACPRGLLGAEGVNDHDRDGCADEGEDLDDDDDGVADETCRSRTSRYEFCDADQRRQDDDLCTDDVGPP